MNPYSVRMFCDSMIDALRAGKTRDVSEKLTRLREIVQRELEPTERPYADMPHGDISAENAMAFVDDDRR